MKSTNFLDAVQDAFLKFESPYLRFSLIYWGIFILVVLIFNRKIFKLDNFERLAAFFSLLGLYVFSLIFYLSKAYKFSMGDKWGDIGPLGDLIGGTTVAFFTLASLILLVGTVRTQRTEMQNTNNMMHIQQVEQTYFLAASSFMETRNRLVNMPLINENKPIQFKLKSNLLCAPWLDPSMQHPNAYSNNYTKISPKELNQLTVLQYNNSRLYQLLFLQSVVYKPSKYIRLYGFSSWFDILLLVHFKLEINAGIEEIYDEMKDFIETSGMPNYKNLDAILSENEETVPSLMFSDFREHFDDISKEIVFKCFNLALHLIKKNDSEDKALQMLKVIHYEIPVFAIKDNQTLFSDLPSTLQSFMTIAHSTAIIQFYDEFKWIIRYLITNLKSYNTNNANFSSEYRLYLDHLSNKLQEDDLLCVAILLAIEYDTALFNSYQNWADSKVLKDLKDKYHDIQPKHRTVDGNHPAFSTDKIIIDASQESKESFIVAYKNVENQIEKVAPKILIDNQSIIQFRNDLFESKFFTKIKTNIDLGCMYETLIPNKIVTNKDIKDIENRLKEIVLIDYKEVYEELLID
ncbi:hypothetical protein V7266_10835 [Neobacillus drentensis]|uniref:hypothetical protein n=1 Tax=Neobacillus drentensis TaxID=220684 RepID=UPI002FFFCC43